MKLRSSGILGLVCFSSMLAFDLKIDCKDVAASSLLDALWFTASVAVNQAITDSKLQGDGNGDGAGQPAPGPPGADGRDGVDGADGRDGVDGQDGADGRDGVDGMDGMDGRDGVDGVDGQDGADGAPGLDATGAVAIASVPATGDLSADSALRGVKFPPNVSTMNVRIGTGRYNIPIDLSNVTPERLGKPLDQLTGDDIAVFVTVQTDANGPPGGPGVPALLFAYYEILDIDAVNLELLVQVKIRTISNVLANADFSMAVYIGSLQ